VICTISIFIVLFIAAFGKSVMDTVKHHFKKSIFAKLNKFFWDPEFSSNNKWKNGDSTQGEKFFLSSTILVFLTDAWHRFQFVFLNGMFIVIGLFPYMHLTGWILTDIIVLRIWFGLSFELFYKYVLIKK